MTSTRRVATFCGSTSQDIIRRGGVDSELMCLSALCEEGLPVPMPVLTSEGGLSVEVSVPGVPVVRRC